MKRFKEFANEDLQFGGKSGHRIISKEYSVGDDIYFAHTGWDYKEKKQTRTKEKGKIVELIDYDDDNWGTLNVCVVPENEDIHDKYGQQWIGQSDILGKV